MDYKYIEQLLERYWQCETSLAEEEILRTFFEQEDVPAQLLPYKSLFTYERAQKDIKLDDDFEAKLLAKIDEPVVKARRISFARRLRPLFKAAAIVAIVLTLGNAAQRSFNQTDTTADYNYDSYTDTYTDPQVAYDHVSTALRTVSEGLSELRSDSLKQSGTTPEKSVKE